MSTSPARGPTRIDALFDDLAAFLPGFLERVLEKQANGNRNPSPLKGPFGVEAQRFLGERLMVQLGFDFEAGRLDVSLHPFCSGVPGDIRVTTRYDTADFAQSVMAVLHETGHALYNAGLPPEWRRQPVGSARGMAMHESQSLMVEMQACRSAEFIGFLAPLARDAFGGAGPAWSAENLRRLYRRVVRSLIRVDADEVTYPAHVILRYRLERALIGGGLSLDDLPEAWAEGLEDLLGIRPPDDASGCLQDIHWYSGTWGYFPTYALGALAAAQLFGTALTARPEIPDALSVETSRLCWAGCARPSIERDRCRHRPTICFGRRPACRSARARSSATWRRVICQTDKWEPAKIRPLSDPVGSGRPVHPPPAPPARGRGEGKEERASLPLPAGERGMPAEGRGYPERVQA